MPGPGQGLPPPDADALLHSARVTAAVRNAIAAAGGWISFRDYMRIVLYAPGLGYYAAGAQKIGPPDKAGDFVTAPEMSSLFGHALANQFTEVLAASGGGILELGAGSGKLAIDVLDRLDALGVECMYSILETSPDLRARQRATISALAPMHGSRIRWLDALPDTWTGVIFGNEVLDALPVEWLARRDGRAYRHGVALDDDGTLRILDREADAGNLEVGAAGAGNEVGAVGAGNLAAGAVDAGTIEALFPPGDYASEINPEGEALSRTLGSILRSGLLLWIDYGFAAREYYHPQRTTGTLMCHYRHRAHDDPLLWPGLQDITAHVDFSAMASATCDSGVDLSGYTAQSSFLIGCGIVDLMSECGAPGSAAYLRESNAVQRLLSPAEMGELFKVIAFTRGIDFALRGFATGDRSRRL